MNLIPSDSHQHSTSTLPHENKINAIHRSCRRRDVVVHIRCNVQGRQKARGCCKSE